MSFSYSITPFNVLLVGSQERMSEKNIEKRLPSLGIFKDFLFFELIHPEIPVSFM